MNFNDKIYTDSKAITSQIAQWKAEGKKIVFTNGCFDLLHIGHVSYLQEARNLGDILIMGINSDASVSRLKGPSRPIKDETNRMAIIASLACVDMVIRFDTETPLDLIKLVLPDILVKGGDWAIDQIVGAREVINNDGEVKSLQFIEGYSSTAIVEKIVGDK